MDLFNKIKDGSAVIGVIGLGYVGLPLAIEFARKNFNVVGFDTDEKKIPLLKSGKSYIKHIPSENVKQAVDVNKLDVTSDFSKISDTDAIIICVPTPLNKYREPDMSYVESTAEVISKYLKPGQLVSLESTTYPGTTDELILPILENSPLIQEKNSEIKKYKVGEDFYLAFSPEREDPNNPDYTTSNIPKVIGGVTEVCCELATALYDQVIVKTVRVKSARVAEATKLLENIYRSVNIAMVNELKMIFDRMDIDIWDVIEAAKTKPFGFNAFYPGPGLGGHCIPIDPFYLSWKAREYDANAKFIELAGEINTLQPYYVIERLSDALNNKQSAIQGSSVLILGAAYKKNIDDMRESPTLKLIDILLQKGADVDYHDPFVPKLNTSRKYDFTHESIALTPENIEKYDVVLVSTDHDDVDYLMIEENAKLIIDTRNVFSKKGIVSSKIFKA